MNFEIRCYNAPRGTTLSESDKGELVMAAEHNAAIDTLRNQVAKSRAEIAKLQQEQAELQEALEHARLFIRNGIELGFIRMPDADTPDPAHDTLPKIEKALATCSQAQQGGSND
ncbi:hypothetical protein ACI2KX_15765 [Ectopseudomonas khazarica]|uniref:hypothetical protein n=1 Tax=Ectopseudomonas khazarica TaxID=2502979 RepID=UPI0038516075